MQRIDGRGLDRLISDDDAPQLTAKQVASLGAQAASALAYAHDQNVLHRDIKPANLIVDEHLQLWVTDFGVAKAIESEAVTRTGDIVGTLRYMAPEQIVGDSDVRSDIYSLGVTLYELLAGRPAMDDAAIREALFSRRPAPEPPRLRQLNPDVPRDLESILHTAMAIDPRGRYQSAQALADDLQSFLDDEPISIRRLSLIELATRWGRRNPAVAALSALSFLLLAGVAIVSSYGFIQVQSALDREQNTRLRAEATATLASDALDDIFRRFAGASDAAVDSSDFSSTPALSAEAVDLLEDLLHYFDELAARSDFDPKLQQSAVDARYAIGDIHFKLGHYDRAIEAFELSLADSNEIADPEARRLREARIRNRIGLAHRIGGNDQRAESEHQISLAVLRSGGNTSGEPSAEFQFELARTHYLLAAHVRPGMGPTAMPPIEAVEMPSSDHRFPPRRPPPRRPRPPGLGGDDRDQDRAHLQAAVEILRNLRTADPQHVGYALALAASLRQLENNARSPASLHGSSSESIRLLRMLHQSDPDNETVRFELSETLADLSIFGMDLQDSELKTKIAQLREALEHFELLADSNPNVPKYTNAVVHTHFKLAALLDRLSEITHDGSQREMEQQAGVSLREAAERYEVLLRRHPDASGYRAWHALFLQHQGGNSLKTGLLDQAEQVLLRSIAQWKRLIKTDPRERISWHALPVAYELLSHAQHRLDKHTEAKESMDQAELSRIYRDMDR